MKAPHFRSDGTRVDEVELPPSIFEPSYNPTLIAQVIRTERANNRQSSFRLKGRGQVSGGGKKPWAQKGTGNARQGSIRSPQWKGGGAPFGSQKRNYKVSLPKRMRRAGMRSVFSKRAGEGAISILDSFKMESYSTSRAYAIFLKMGLFPSSTIVFVAYQADDKMKKSFINIQNIRLVCAERILLPEILYAGQLVISDSALPFLEEKYHKQRQVSRGSFSEEGEGES